MDKILSAEESRKALIFGDGELKKATLTYMQTETKKKVTIPVQFNPTNYSISRSVSCKEKKVFLKMQHQMMCRQQEATWQPCRFV